MHAGVVVANNVFHRVQQGVRCRVLLSAHAMYAALVGWVGLLGQLKHCSALPLSVRI